MKYTEVFVWFCANLPRILIFLSILSSCLWLLSEVRFKRFACFFFGLMTIILLAGYSLLVTHVRSFYDSDVFIRVVKCAVKVLEKGETNTVIDAFGTFLKDVESSKGYCVDQVYYETRNKMWLKLHEAAEIETKTADGNIGH